MSIQNRVEVGEPSLRCTWCGAELETKPHMN